MENNALLYEILINKSKLKPLSSNGETVPEPSPSNFSFTSLTRIVDEKHFAYNNNEPTEAIQFFTQECMSSKTVCDNKEAFAVFLRTEVPLLLTKFEKTIVGKVE